jgi:hypothetical protein
MEISCQHNSPYIVSFNNNVDIICDKIELIDETPFIRFSNCKIQFKAFSTIPPEKTLRWDKETLIIYTRQNNKFYSNYALEIPEYIIKKEDFKKARTYNDKLAHDLNIDWAKETEESATTLANKIQEQDNKEIIEKNIEDLNLLILQLRKLYFIGKRYNTYSNRRTNAILEKNKNNPLPETITKKLKEDLNNLFPNMSKTQTLI